MILTIKNKLTIDMANSIKKSKEAGGIPNVFLLSSIEARDFIIELNKNQAIIRSSVTIHQKSNEHPDIRLTIWGHDPINIKTILKYVDLWKRKEIEFKYQEISIVVRDPPPPNVKPKSSDGTINVPLLIGKKITIEFTKIPVIKTSEISNT
jgi:hypothetical protein